MKDDNERILELIQNDWPLAKNAMVTALEKTTTQHNGGLRLTLGPKWD